MSTQHDTPDRSTDTSESQADDDHNWLPNGEILGEIIHQDTATDVKILQVQGGEDGVYVKADWREYRAEVLNIATSAAGLSVGSKLHLDGDRLKRVTYAKTADRTYVYVEIGNREN